MSIELRLPHFDLPGTPVTVCSWHVKIGQKVIEGDRLVEVHAGDVTIDLPAPASGVLSERCAEIDQIVAAGDVLARIAAE